jgi:hypothetical protein
VGYLNRLRQSLQRLERAAFERDLRASCGRPSVLRHAVHTLDAAEGLFTATILSLILWSLILFTVSHLR